MKYNFLRYVRRIDRAEPSTLLLNRTSKVLLMCFLVFLFPCACVDVVGQNPTQPDAEVSAAKTAKDDNRYRIGPGDVLSIVVRKTPELSGSVRVDQRGMIRLPMIDGDILAACHTEHELAEQITSLYLEYKTNPNVEVFVTDFQSRPVAVIGAVNAPGQFRLQRQVRLLELLSLAGGPAAGAGRTVNVIHTGGPNPCRKGSTTGEDIGLGVVKLNDTLKGKEGANPFVEPGDIIQIPDADQVFVIGHVVQPRSIALKDKTITVSWAIAMAGGAARDGKTSSIRIVRENEAGQKQEIFVNLQAIQQHRAPDITLLPNDIVEVGASASKTILSILTGAVPGALQNSVVRVIP